MVLTATAHPSVPVAGLMTPPCGFCAGDRIADGFYHLHSRFDRAANFIGVPGLVCLVDASLGAGPNTITLDAALRNASDSMSIRFPLLTLGDIAIDLSDVDIFDSGIEPLTQAIDQVLPNIDRFRHALPEHAPPISIPGFVSGTSRHRSVARRPSCETFLSSAFTRIASGIRMLADDRLVEGLKLIAGCGPGLTPSGDDFIAGWLTGLHVATLWFDRDESDRIGVIRQTAPSANPIVQSQFRFAVEGRVTESMKTLLASLTADEGMVDRSVQRICGRGASSGADYLAGFLFTFDQEFFACH